MSQEQLRTEIQGTVTWPEGTGVITVVVEPGRDADALRNALLDVAGMTGGVIVEAVAYVNQEGVLRVPDPDEVRDLSDPLYDPAEDEGYDFEDTAEGDT